MFSINIGNKSVDYTNKEITINTEGVDKQIKENKEKSNKKYNSKFNKYNKYNKFNIKIPDDLK